MCRLVEVGRGERDGQVPDDPGGEQRRAEHGLFSGEVMRWYAGQGVKSLRRGADGLAAGGGQCDDRRVDRYVDQAWLDWRANDTLAFDCGEVEVEISYADGDGLAYARLVRRTPESDEEFRFLHDLSPYFTLRFPGDGTVEVQVGDICDLDRFELTEYRPDDHAAS